MAIPPAKIILTLALTLATATLSVSAASSTINYFSFFPSLVQLHVRIASIDVRTDQVLIGNATLAIENPTSYTGLFLSSWSSNFTTTNPNGSIVIPQGIIPSSTLIPGPLNPNSPVMVTLPLLGFGDGPRRAVTEIVSKGEKITYQISITLYLETSLERLIPNTAIPYYCTSTGGPGSCEQVGIAIGPYSSGGSRGSNG